MPVSLAVSSVQSPRDSWSSAITTHPPTGKAIMPRDEAVASSTPPAQASKPQNYGSLDSRLSSSSSADILPARSRSGTSLPPHTREHGLAPHSPLFSSYALVLRHRESSGDSLSPLHPRKDEEAAGSQGAYFTLVKVCMGTGALALPYAFLSGGLVWSALGIVLMAKWNYFAIQRLLACKELLDSVATGAEDVEANNMYAFIALKSLGRPGKLLVHVAMGITFIGCGVSYLIAASDLLEATPLSLLFVGAPMWTRFGNTLLCLLVVLPLSCAKSLSFLSYTSLFGVLALLLSFATIIALGINNTPPAAIAAAAAAAKTGGLPTKWARAFSTDAQGLSRFFGITCFSFGIPPLLFPIEGSMHRPEFLGSAVRLALVSVAAAYILIAEATVVLYDFAIPPNILSVLPDSILSTFVRLLMVMVCLLTYPLAIVPLCESVQDALEGPRVPRMYRWESLQPGSSQYEERETAGFNHRASSASLQDQENGAAATTAPGASPPSLLHGGDSVLTHMPRYQQRRSDAESVWSAKRLLLRAGIVFTTSILSTVVPCFGVVVSFMGAFSVAILSFVLPPLFHLMLFKARSLRTEALWDVCMFLLGLLACACATSLTAKSSLGPIVHSHRCPG
eukprot:evm.model.NODE_4935_length_22065_cov_15.706367.2